MSVILKCINYIRYRSLEHCKLWVFLEEIESAYGDVLHWCVLAQQGKRCFELSEIRAEVKGFMEYGRMDFSWTWWFTMDHGFCILSGHNTGSSTSLTWSCWAQASSSQQLMKVWKPSPQNWDWKLSCLQKASVISQHADLLWKRAEHSVGMEIPTAGIWWAFCWLQGTLWHLCVANGTYWLAVQ